MSGMFARRGIAALLVTALAGLMVIAGASPAAASVTGSIPGVVMHVLDENAGTVMRIGPDGATSPVDIGGRWASAVALADDGTLYFTDYGNQKVIKKAPDGTVSEVPFTGLNNPANIAVDSAGAVYVANSGLSQVLKLSGNTQTVVPFTGLDQPIAVAVGADGNVYVTDWRYNSDSKLFRLDSSSGGTQTELASGGMDYPYGLIVDDQRNAYVAAGNDGVVVKVAPDGSRTNLGTGLATPRGLGMDGDGQLYATLVGYDYITKLPGTNFTTAITGLSSPGAMAMRVVPTAPTTVTATPGNTTADVSWSGATDNGGPPINWYKATASPGGRSCTTATTSCTITGLDNSQTYSFTVTASNTGNEIGSSEPSEPQEHAPDAPTGLSAVPGNASATVTFTPGSDNGSTVTRWEVSSDGGTNWSTLTTSDAGGGKLSAPVSPLTNDVLATLWVRAVNAGGDGPHATTTVTPVPDLPDPPTALVATPADESATLVFEPPVNTGGGTLTYQVSIDGGTNWTTLTTAPSGGGASTRTGTVGSLTNGTPYTVMVRARNSAGPSTAVQDSVTPARVPDAPTALVATRANASATLVFEPPANDGGAAVSSYQVSIDGGTNWTTLTTAPSGGGATTRTGTVGSLTNGTPYTVMVRARNSAGPSTAVQDSVTPATVPDAPTALVATRGNESATLVFEPPAGDGGDSIIRYEVSTDGGTNWTTLTTAPSGGGATTRTGTVSSLINGTAYTVRVRAVNTVGPGTDAQDAVTPATAPDAPTALVATAADQSATLVFAPPAGDGGDSVIRYEVSTDGGTNWTTLTTAPSGGGATTRTGTVGSLTNGTPYSVRVRAVNTVGPSTGSNTASVTPVDVPGPPTALVATRGDRSATLVFEPPTTGAVTGYEVSTDDGATWAALTATPSGGGATTYTGTVGSLINGTTYTVKVRAVNGSAPGTASTAATVVPATTPAAPTDFTGVGGNSSAQLSFLPPADNGGSAVTGYEISTNRGTSWRTLTTSAGTAGHLTGTVTNLINGAQITVLLRARNALGGGATASVTVRPMSPVVVLPPPPATTPTPAPSASSPTPAPSSAGPSPVVPAPANVSAVAGTSSITVSWTAPADSAAITGYRAIASPGPATCTATGRTATSCVLGATAGTAYTVTVVALAANGTSAASAPGGPVTVSAPPTAALPPAADAPLTTDRGDVATVRAGAGMVVVGTGFAPYSTVTVTLYSMPVALATGIADADGAISIPVTLPDALADGPHSIVAVGVDRTGAPRALRLDVTATEAGTDPELPVTGAAVLWLVVAGAAGVVAGTTMRQLSRKTTARR